MTIPLFKVRMSPCASHNLEKTLNSGFITQGPRVDEFEEAVSMELNLPGAPIAVSSATAGIDLALDCIGVGPGDEVISTPLTCFATNIGALRRGARIRWADISPYTGNIDPFSVQELITPRTRAILAVNWAGQFADYAGLKSFGIPVVEDAAHTWDSFDHDEERGDYIVYSLQAIKFLTAGDGGILVTPENRHQEARNLRWYGLDRDNRENFRNTQNITKAGFKFNMNDISASIALSNIKDAHRSVLKHQRNARMLSDALMKIDWAFAVPYRETSSYWVFPVIMVEDNRNPFEQWMNAQGIQTAQVHFRNDSYDVMRDFVEGGLPGVDSFSSHQTNIPCGWWMDERDVQFVIDRIMEYGAGYVR